MTIRFAYTKSDGGVAIVIATPKEVLTRLIGKPINGSYELSDEEYIAHVLDRSIPKDAENLFRLPDDWEPPKDRTFRNAWVTDGKTVSVDMVKAREIHRANIQAASWSLIVALDIQYRVADDAANSDAKAAIATKRQALRNIINMPEIDAAQTPEELKAVWPKELA